MATLLPTNRKACKHLKLLDDHWYDWEATHYPSGLTYFWADRELESYLTLEQVNRTTLAISIWSTPLGTNRSFSDRLTSDCVHPFAPNSEIFHKAFMELVDKYRKPYSSRQGYDLKVAEENLKPALTACADTLLLTISLYYATRNVKDSRERFDNFYSSLNGRVIL